MKDEGLLQKLALPFVLLTMCITWTSWWTIVIANHYGYLAFGTPLMMGLYTLGVIAPAIASIAVILHTNTMSGKELCKELFNFKQPIRFYMMIIIINGLAYILPLLLDRATIIAPIYMALLLIPFNLIGGGLEEIGWRFLLQPALEKKFNFTIATIVTAAIWALWHLPLFFMIGTNQASWNYGAFVILILGMSFLLASLYKVTKSIFVCILFHTLWNATGESIAINMEISVTIIMSISLILISFLLLKMVKNTKLRNIE
ncbi:MAG: type II CAAX endopeptidase family protein [Lachnospiraceae bacterium]|nr:type II CAAX endopeptidase family protein [Lachnospiraceae bacterium]